MDASGGVKGTKVWPFLASVWLGDEKAGFCWFCESERERLKVDVAVSVTGLAGPGGDGVHPSGDVWFGLATERGVTSENVVFPGDRATVRAAAVEHALGMLLTAAG